MTFERCRVICLSYAPKLRNKVTPDISGFHAYDRIAFSRDYGSLFSVGVFCRLSAAVENTFFQRCNSCRYTRQCAGRDVLSLGDDEIQVFVKVRHLFFEGAY